MIPGYAFALCTRMVMSGFHHDEKASLAALGERKDGLLGPKIRKKSKATSSSQLANPSFFQAEVAVRGRWHQSVLDKAGQWGYCLLPSLGPNSGNCINTSLYNNASLTEQSPYCGRPHSSPSYKNSSLFRRRGLFFLSFSQAHGLRASLNFRCELAQTFALSIFTFLHLLLPCSQGDSARLR